MMRIGFAGVPGSGKTSTARGLAAACRGIKGLENVELSAEYARRYIIKHGGITDIWEQFRILKKQMDWEESVGDANLVITDAPIFMGMMYAQMLSKGTPKDVMVMNDLFSELNKANNPRPRYDIIFHLPPLLKPVDDGVRPASNFDPHWREKANNSLLGVFEVFKPYLFFTVDLPNLEMRVEWCRELIAEYIRQCNEAGATLHQDNFDAPPLPDVFYIEVNGIIHRADAHGIAKCEHASAAPQRLMPVKGQQCPICFGGGSA